MCIRDSLAIAEILPVSADFVRQDPAGGMPLSRSEPLCHFPQISRLIVGEMCIRDSLYCMRIAATICNLLSEIVKADTEKSIEVNAIYRKRQKKCCARGVLLCYQTMFPHTIGVFLKQFFLLVRHSGFKLFFVPADQLQ